MLVSVGFSEVDSQISIHYSQQLILVFEMSEAAPSKNQLKNRTVPQLPEMCRASKLPTHKGDKKHQLPKHASGSHCISQIILVFFSLKSWFTISPGLASSIWWVYHHIYHSSMKWRQTHQSEEARPREKMRRYSGLLQYINFRILKNPCSLFHHHQLF